MPSKRVIQAGHLLAVLFTALLLLGARTFLVEHPIVAGLLLAACAPAYYVAARITGYRQFLYPGLLLWVLAYHLLLYAAGVPFQRHALAALIPIGIIALCARAGIPRAIEGGAQTLYGTNHVLIFVFAVGILFRPQWFLSLAAVTTGVALLGYAAFLWWRFRETNGAWHLSAAVVLGSGGFLYLLYSHPAVSLFLASLVLVRFAGDLYARKLLPVFEAVAFLLAAVYLVFMAARAVPASIIPLGYLALGSTWLLAAVLLGQASPQGTMPLGPLVTQLPRVVPLFIGGIVLPLLPIALFYPWKPITLAGGYLTIFFLIFFVTGRELAKSSLTLIGVALTRILSLLGRAAPWAWFAYLAWAKFPPSYRLSLATLSVALLSFIAAWRQKPRVLVRRNFLVYQAAVFLSVAYILAERRVALTGAAGILMDSGILAVLALAGLGYLLRQSAPYSYVKSLWEATCAPAAAACVAQVVTGSWTTPSALLIGGYLVIASYLSYLLIRRPAALFTWPVVLGFWIYILQWAGGIRGEALGLPYLIFGAASAALGYLFFQRKNAWFELLYFMWFLCTAVSLGLFYPYMTLGGYGAPLWALVFLLVGFASASRLDFPFALVLEILSGLLAAASTAVLIYNRAYLAAAVALMVYALQYAWAGTVRRAWWYLYPSAGCLVGAWFMMVLRGPGARLFLPYFFPLALALYLLAVWLRRSERSRDARPFEWAAHAGVAVGALLFLTLPFGEFFSLGWITGLLYLLLFAGLTNLTGELGFLAGVGMAGAFAVYQLLPVLPSITRGNRLAGFVPMVIVLALLGRIRETARDRRGAWGFYAASVVAAVLSALAAVWPPVPSLTASRIVLLVTMAVWVLLLWWTRLEVFIYCATLGLAMLAYNFVQSSADIFGQHLVAFFLYGTLVLGLIFVAAAMRHRLRMREPLLMPAAAHWPQRLLYLLPVGVLGLATFGSWGVSTSSNPHFCGTCHDMKTYFTTWKADPHARADIACYSCHYEPGLRGFLRAKVKGTSELVTTLTGTQGFKPIAEVRNATCLTSGCHSMAQLQKTLYVGGVYYFRHDLHLAGTGRGPELRCTSCHGEVSDRMHFAVDTNACFTCHFKAASDPKPATQVGCVACHSLPSAGKFDHVSAGIENTDTACAACHERVATGSPRVEERQCRHCHTQSTAVLLQAGQPAIHRKHVGDRGVNCDWCHGVVRHGTS